MKRLCFLAVAGGALLAVAALYLSGTFDAGRIDPGRIESARMDMEPEETAIVRVESVTQWAEAVGTVRPRTETRVESQVTGRVLKVLVRSGAKVKKGQPLLVLDDRQLRARSEQAREGLAQAGAGAEQADQAVNAARAGFDRAKSSYERLEALHRQKAVTSEEMERAQAGFLQARASLEQAQDGVEAAKAQVRRAAKMVEEAEIATGYATIRAQADGEVSSRKVDPGDLAFPGKELMTVQTGDSLRLEALVREGLIGRVRLGGELPVAVSALDQILAGTIEEIEPSADPSTRSFVVKAGLPSVPGLYPGMFGRLMIPLDEIEVVMVPERAVNRVGQLATVLVRTGGGWESVYVTTGKASDGRVEILSGLGGGESVALSGSRP